MAKYKKLKLGADIRVKQAEEYLSGESGSISIDAKFKEIESGKLDKVTTVTAKEQMYVKHADGTQGMADIPEGAAVDTEMSDTSVNAVQNKVIKKYVDDKDVLYIALTGTSGTLTDEQRQTLLKGQPTNNFIDKDNMLFKCVFYKANNKAVYSISGESKIHVITVTLPAGTWSLTTYELQGKLTAGDDITIVNNVINTKIDLDTLATKIELNKEIGLRESGDIKLESGLNAEILRAKEEESKKLDKLTTTESGKTFAYVYDKDGQKSVDINTFGKVSGVKGDNESTYRTGDVNITKDNIGLSNVTNDAQLKVSDRHTVIESGTTNKIPTVQAVYEYHDTSKVDVSTKGAANGVASLDIDGKVPTTQLPDAILGQLIFGGSVERKEDTGETRTLAYPTSALKERLGITADTIQLVNSATDEPSATPYPKFGYKTLEKIYFICRNEFTVESTTFEIGDWLLGAGTYWDIIKNADAVTSVNDKRGAVVLTTADVQPATGATTNLYVSKTEKDTWTGKQDALESGQLAAVNSGITSTKVSSYDTHIADTNIHVTLEKKNAWDAKQDGLTTDQLKAVNSGIESGKVASYDTHIADTALHIQTGERAKWDAKQDAISDLANIRKGAESGLTAVQPAALTAYRKSADQDTIDNVIKGRLDVVESGKQDKATLESDVADKGFTKNTGTITGIKMNGASKGTSGEVDLGTVITEHQSLADYRKAADQDTIDTGLSTRITAVESGLNTKQEKLPTYVKDKYLKIIDDGGTLKPSWENAGGEGTITDVKVNGTSVVTSGIANVTVPTKTSDITNDSGFITKEESGLTNYRKAADQDIIDAVFESGIEALESGKQDKLESGQLEAINSGITATKVTKYDNYETTKQDKIDLVIESGMLCVEYEG